MDDVSGGNHVRNPGAVCLQQRAETGNPRLRTPECVEAGMSSRAPDGPRYPPRYGGPIRQQCFYFQNGPFRMQVCQ